MRRNILSLLVASLILIGVAVGNGSTGRLASAQGPTATPTQAVEINPINPTATPKRPVAGNPSGGDGAISGTPIPDGKPVKPPKTLDELKQQFPDLGPFIEKYKDAKVGEIDFSELYAKIIAVYDKEGATGVATFLSDSGLLDKLGIPLSYLDLLRAFDKGGLEAVEKLARTRQIINDDDEVIAYVAIDADENLKAVSDAFIELGVTVYKYSDQLDELEIGIPLAVLGQFQTPGKLLEYLTKIVNVEHIIGFRAPAPSITNGPKRQNVEGLGAKTMGADAWQKAGLTGKGVRVGVLDMGFGGINAQLGTTLPAEVIANYDLDELDQQEENHGLAVAMVIHSVAPEAELFMAYFDGSSYDSFLSALDFLKENKVQVLNFSVGSSIGPRDGTFGDAITVDEFVRETGALWITAAGNYAESHTVFEFNEGSDGFHLFGQDKKGNDVYTMPFIAGEPVTSVAMNWNGNWKGGEKSQYDFIITDRDGNELLTANETKRGRKNDFPFQINAFEAEPGEIYFMSIHRTKGTTNNVIDIFIPNGLLVPWAQVPAYSVTTPGDSDSSLTVGATGLTEDKLESYSSQGPTTDNRIKPDISAPTGEIVPGYDEGFNGTSGAAPMVAGVAALVIQAQPEISEAELKAFLVANVVDLGESGADPQFGAGRLQLPAPNGDFVSKDDDDNTGGNTTSDQPAGEITSLTAKFNVKVKSQTGMQVKTSFTLDNYQGKSLIVALLFTDENGDKVPSGDRKFAINGTIGTALAIKPKAKQSAFKDVVLFIPNSAFKGVQPGDIFFEVGVIDATDPDKLELLAASEKQKVTVSKR